MADTATTTHEAPPASTPPKEQAKLPGFTDEQAAALQHLMAATVGAVMHETKTIIAHHVDQYGGLLATLRRESEENKRTPSDSEKRLKERAKKLREQSKEKEHAASQLAFAARIRENDTILDELEDHFFSETMELAQSYHERMKKGEVIDASEEERKVMRDFRKEISRRAEDIEQKYGSAVDDYTKLKKYAGPSLVGGGAGAITGAFLTGTAFGGLVGGLIGAGIAGGVILLDDLLSD